MDEAWLESQLAQPVPTPAPCDDGAHGCDLTSTRCVQEGIDSLCVCLEGYTTISRLATRCVATPSPSLPPSYAPTFEPTTTTYVVQKLKLYGEVLPTKAPTIAGPPTPLPTSAPSKPSAHPTSAPTSWQQFFRQMRQDPNYLGETSDEQAQAQTQTVAGAKQQSDTPEVTDPSEQNPF